MKEFVKTLISVVASLLLGFALGRYYERQQNPINKVKTMLDNALDTK